MEVKNFLRDHLFIKNLEVETRIGTTPEERAFPQVVFVSAEAFLSLSRAGKNDRLSDSVDYAEIIEKIRGLLKKRTFKLVEKAAEEIAKLILEYGAIQGVRVSVAKKILAGVQFVGASIYREK